MCEFVTDTLAKFRGATQSNPFAPAPYRGLWQSPSQALSIDFLTYVFGLVRLDQAQEGLDHFTSWKQRLEAGLNQELCTSSKLDSPPPPSLFEI